MLTSSLAGGTLQIHLETVGQDKRLHLHAFMIGIEIAKSVFAKDEAETALRAAAQTFCFFARAASK